MSRALSPLSKNLLSFLQAHGPVDLKTLYSQFKTDASNKEIYNTVFRLVGQELVENKSAEKKFVLTEEGNKTLLHLNPKRDGVWKLIIFDIPESKREVRNFIRSRLKSLGFKKWQNSIWVSPYILHTDIETELNQLAEKFFVRLIKTTDINYTKDLEKLFN